MKLSPTFTPAYFFIRNPKNKVGACFELTDSKMGEQCLIAAAHRGPPAQLHGGHESLHLDISRELENRHRTQPPWANDGIRPWPICQIARAESRHSFS
jgi:hypothetical protein